MTTLDILPEVTCPPTDLWSDEPPLESDLHLQQIIILLNCLELLWQEKNDYYASGNLTIYYNEEQLKKRDRTKKKILYQNTFRTPNYFWFDPNTLEFQGFTILEGQYQAISPNDRGYLWSEQLGLYLGIFDRKLRYFTADGQLVPTPQEAELQQRQAKEQILLEKEQILLEKEQERQAKEQALLEKEQALLEKEQERQAKERLAAKLRELGINPQTI